MSAPTEERSYYFKQHCAFSTNYLDYEIPDFRGSIGRAVPLLVLSTGILNADLQPVSAGSLHELIRSAHTNQTALVCNDAVLFHCLALQHAETDEQREAIWQLTDNHALWDVELLEQRIAWSTAGRIVGRPPFENLLNQYHAPENVGPHGRSWQRFGNQVPSGSEIDDLFDLDPQHVGIILPKRELDSGDQVRLTVFDCEYEEVAEEVRKLIDDLCPELKSKIAYRPGPAHVFTLVFQSAS